MWHISLTISCVCRVLREMEGTSMNSEKQSSNKQVNLICFRFYNIFLITGCLQLLEILEISWNLIGRPVNFYVRCRRSTALVSSHKNMDKYLSQKYEIYRHQMCSFKFQMHQNPFSAGTPSQTPVGDLMMLPQIPIQLGRGHRELKYPCYGYFSSRWRDDVPSEGGQIKANMSWIFLKIPPKIWKFAWLNL